MFSLNQKIKGLLLSLVIAGASQLTYSHDYKIGIFDTEQLLMKCPQHRELKKEYDEKFADRETSLRKREKTYHTKVEQFKRDQEILSQSERTKAEREIVRLEQELQLQGREYQDDVMRYNQDSQRTIAQAIELAKNEIAKEQHFDLLLPKTPLLYASNDLDVTSDVLAKMKAQYQPSLKSEAKKQTPVVTKTVESEKSNPKK